MKRLFIIVEGQTEEEFVNTILAPYLAAKSIYHVTPIIIHTSGRHYKGGFVNFQHLKNDIKRLLSSQGNDIVVTTFVDYFRIPNDIPMYAECMAKSSDEDRVSAMEAAIDADIDDHRFFSYIQLHEFEALLFSTDKGFAKYWAEPQTDGIRKIIDTYSNPEDINSSPQGAPSKRILAISPSYDKVMEGNLIALEIGLHTIRNKCPRFSNWIDRIVQNSV